MMRRQAYEWRAVVPDLDYANNQGAVVLNLDPVLSSQPAIPAWTAGSSAKVDVFVGDYGNNLDIPGYVKATQFIVIDEISLWPPAATANIWVDTTQYFLNPDRSVSKGISGNASPFGPSGGRRYVPQALSPSYYQSATPVYVLPGQTWGVYYSLNDLTPTLTVYDKQGGSATINWDYTINASIPLDDGDCFIPRCYFEYVLFDGSDALVANHLMEQNIPVNVENVMAHKRMLIRMKLEKDISDQEELETVRKTVPRRFI